MLLAVLLIGENNNDNNNFIKPNIIVISINLLALYHECGSLIGYATHVLFNN